MGAAADLVLVGRRVVTPEGERPGAVLVRDGRIVDVEDDVPAGARAVVDLGDLALLPGLVDSHVHVNEPGRTHWEGFHTATRAAAAGGVTTIVDMPLNSLPPTTTVAALAVKRAAAGPQAFVDVGFWGGVVPGSEEHVAALHEAGVLGFKAFLCDSGVPEYPHFAPGAIAGVLGRTAAVGSTLLVHAEDPSHLRATDGADPARYATWLDSRPAQAEEAAVAAVVDAARLTGGRAHVLHLSAASAGDQVAAARAEGLPITAETCPHYLTLAAEAIPDGATEHKCAPPIRDRANADRLWDALAAGTLDAVVSDHSPCPPEGKTPGNFVTAWGGIASLQLGLPLVWTQASARGHELSDLARWMSAGPAAIAGLATKGAIAPGFDADLVVFDPDARWTVDAKRLHHRHPVSPYHGREVRGAVRATYLRGRRIASDDRVEGPAQGRLLARGTA